MNLNDFQKTTGQWQRDTFTEASPVSVMAHLRKEVDELAVAVGRRGEPDADGVVEHVEP